LLRIETVHFNQQRVQSLLAFIVAAAEAMSPAPPDRVNFVDKDQARSILARLFEHIAHAARADADEHFHKIRTADAEKRRVGLARDGLCEKSLAGAGRAHH